MHFSIFAIRATCLAQFVIYSIIILKYHVMSKNNERTSDIQMVFPGLCCEVSCHFTPFQFCFKRNHGVYNLLHLYEAALDRVVGHWEWLLKLVNFGRSEEYFCKSSSAYLDVWGRRY